MFDCNPRVQMSLKIEVSTNPQKAIYFAKYHWYCELWKSCIKMENWYSKKEIARDYPLLVILDLNIISKSERICPAFLLISCIVRTFLCTQHVLRVLCWILNIFQHFCSNFDPLLTISVQKIRIKNSPIFLTDFILLSMWPSSWVERNLILCKLLLFLFFLWKKFFSFARIYLRKIHQI
jgi:hypothetical protein